jgi:hypothetical protein
VVFFVLCKKQTKKGEGKMKEAQMMTICHTFDCGKAKIREAEQELEKLLFQHGENTYSFLTKEKSRLASEDQEEDYVKVAMLIAILNQQNEFLEAISTIQETDL